MGMGYQRIHDLGPLSIKSLNDQLEALWALVMQLLQAQQG